MTWINGTLNGCLHSNDHLVHRPPKTSGGPILISLTDLDTPSLLLLLLESAEFWNLLLRAAKVYTRKLLLIFLSREDLPVFFFFESCIFFFD